MIAVRGDTTLQTKVMGFAEARVAQIVGAVMPTVMQSVMQSAVGGGAMNAGSGGVQMPIAGAAVSGSSAGTGLTVNGIQVSPEMMKQATQIYQQQQQQRKKNIPSSQ